MGKRKTKKSKKPNKGKGTNNTENRAKKNDNLQNTDVSDMPSEELASSSKNLQENVNEVPREEPAEQNVNLQETTVKQSPNDTSDTEAASSSGLNRTATRDKIIHDLIATFEGMSRPIGNVSTKKTTKENKSTIESNEGQTDNSEAQTQRITSEQATDNFNIPNETIGIIEETVIIARGAIPRTVTTGTQFDQLPILLQCPESRVPYITDPRDFMGPRNPAIPFKPILKLEKIFNDKVSPSIFKGYKLHCMSELTRPKAGYVSLLPGIFTLSLGITHEDDYKIMRIIYPTLQFHPDYNYIQKNCYLLEENVLRYLDNFRTNLLCKIFDSIMRNKNDDFKFITESEYLQQMKVSFSYTHSMVHLDTFTYCAKENKSKYFPGRDSKIVKKFRKQNFE